MGGAERDGQSWSLGQALAYIAGLDRDRRDPEHSVYPGGGGARPCPSGSPQTKQGPGHWELETGKQGELKESRLGRAGASIPWEGHRTRPLLSCTQSTARRQELGLQPGDSALHHTLE